MRLALSPYVSWYSHYIYLKPTGEWSVLPHTGQIYRYTGAKAIIAGTEIALDIKLSSARKYACLGEYNYTYNRDEYIPLTFSPPASMRNRVTWEQKYFNIYAELQSIASQHRVARNEDTTSGTMLFHLGVKTDISLGVTKAIIVLSVHNLFNTVYYNHLSFYRKIQVPESGRNFRILIKIPFKNKLK